MTGKDFETIIMQAMAREEEAGHCTMNRYGVQMVHYNPGSDLIARPIQSLPDFEGVLPPRARQFIFDAKVCSQASFDLAKFRESAKEPKVRQINHLFKRAAFGAITFFLIHWPERVLKTRTDDAITWAMPVYVNHPFWQRFLAGETTSLTRLDCAEYGARVEWVVPAGCHKARPDILSVIRAMSREFKGAPAHSDQPAVEV